MITFEELKAIVARLNGSASYHLHDGGYTIAVSVRPGYRTYLYRASLDWGDASTPEDRIYSMMVADNLISDDMGTTVEHMEGE